MVASRRMCIESPLRMSALVSTGKLTTSIFAVMSYIRWPEHAFAAWLKPWDCVIDMTGSKLAAAYSHCTLPFPFVLFTAWAGGRHFMWRLAKNSICNQLIWYDVNSRSCDSIFQSRLLKSQFANRSYRLQSILDGYRPLSTMALPQSLHIRPLGY